MNIESKMNDFETKRRKLLELDKQKSFVAESVRNQTKDKLRDDIRTLHEAYQFLARKYMRDEEKLKEKMNNRSDTFCAINPDQSYLNPMHTAVLCDVIHFNQINKLVLENKL